MTVCLSSFKLDDKLHWQKYFFIWEPEENINPAMRSVLWKENSLCIFQMCVTDKDWQLQDPAEKNLQDVPFKFKIATENKN